MRSISIFFAKGGDAAIATSELRNYVEPDLVDEVVTRFLDFAVSLFRCLACSKRLMTWSVVLFGSLFLGGVRIFFGLTALILASLETSSCISA